MSSFSKELQQLQTSPHVNLILHSSRQHDIPVSFAPESKEKLTDDILPTLPSRSTTCLEGDVEKGPVNIQVENISTQLHIHQGRPDIPSLIRNAVQQIASQERIIIAACGPGSLIKSVRAASAECISHGGPSIELHCEQFGW